MSHECRELCALSMQVYLSFDLYPSANFMILELHSCFWNVVRLSYLLKAKVFANPAYLTTQIPNCLLCSGQTLKHQLSCLLCLFWRQESVLLGPSRLFRCPGQTQSLGLLNRRAFGCCFLLFVFVRVLPSSPGWLGTWSPQMLYYKYGPPLPPQNLFSETRTESYCWAVWTWHWKQATAFLRSFCSKWCCHSLPDVRGKWALSSVSIHHPAD